MFKYGMLLGSAGYLGRDDRYAVLTYSELDGLFGSDRLSLGVRMLSTVDGVVPYLVDSVDCLLASLRIGFLSSNQYNGEYSEGLIDGVRYNVATYLKDARVFRIQEKTGEMELVEVSLPWLLSPVFMERKPSLVLNHYLPGGVARLGDGDYYLVAVESDCSQLVEGELLSVVGKGGFNLVSRVLVPDEDIYLDMTKHTKPLTWLVVRPAVGRIVNNGVPGVTLALSC